MGAGDWVTGGVRRAVSGVAGLLPGQPPAAQEAVPPAGDPGAVDAVPPEQPEQPAGSGAAPARATRPTTRSTGRKPTGGTSAAATSATATSGAARSGTARASTAAADRTDSPDAQVPPASPWSAEELAGFRAALDVEITRLREELDMGEADLADLVADSGDGSGDDQADAGSKTFEREHEMSVNANTREMLDQALRALTRLEAGTYGLCERCGSPIGAARLRAFPRATLCIRCKQAEERR